MDAITAPIIEMVGTILGLALVVLIKAAFDALKSIERSKSAEALQKHFPAVHESAKDLLYGAMDAGSVELEQLLVGEKYEDLRDQLLAQANTLAKRAGIKADVSEELVDGVLRRAAEEIRLGL